MSPPTSRNRRSHLEYRSLCFESELLDEADHQGVAVVNYTAREVPYTRIIEHKHFEFGTQDKTVITREYPADWKPGDEPYYPINDAKNEALYKQYEELAARSSELSRRFNCLSSLIDLSDDSVLRTGSSLFTTRRSQSLDCSQADKVLNIRKP